MIDTVTVAVLVAALLAPAFVAAKRELPGLRARRRARRRGGFVVEDPFERARRTGYLWGPGNSGPDVKLRRRR